MPFVPSARRFLALFTGTALICLFALCTRGQASASVSSSAAGTAASGATVGSTYGGFSPDGDFLWLSDADLNRQFDLMKQSGASWVRLNIIWSVIEGSRGQFDWSTSDRVVAAARARGLQVLGLLTYTPSWASGSGDDKVAPRNPADIGPFAQAAVQRYTGQGVHAWEIWNEPNLSGTWAPHPDVAAYSALLKAAASAIRSADASATIIAGGLAPGGDAGDGSTISPLSFVRGLYAAGAGPYFSAVALHPYSFPALPMQSGTDDWNAFVRAPLVHQAMVDNGDGAKPIWFTEFGSPTGSAADAVSTNIQAQTIPQAYDQLANWPWAGPLFYYTLRDSGTNSADREQNFGLFRQDYSAKPAWSAFLSEMAKPSAGGPSAPPPPAGGGNSGPGTTGTLQPISALTPTSSSNGYGPYERNKSNGEQVGGDGRQISIRGKGYASGLGVHAMSSVTYSLDGNYRTFTSDVGIDDEVNGHGTVTFEVWVDGTRKFRSSVVTGSSPVVSVTVDVTNAKTLQLVAGDASDGTAYDHADWAGAALQTL